MSLKLLIGFLLLFTCLSITSCFDEAEEKEDFKTYFIKAYHLRFKDERQNGTVAPQKLRRSSSTKLLENAFDRYQKASKLDKYQKVSRNGTTDDKLDLIAEEVWDRTGAEMVEKTFQIVGANVGSQIGGYVGGSLGMAMGVAFPPLQVPLVIGGIFIGKNLGRALGYIGGKIASDFVNNFIAEHLLSPYLVKKLFDFINQHSKNATSSKQVTCRSDICFAGSAEYKCQCRSCKGAMAYSDQNGASSCKTCGLGTYPISDYYGRNIGCRNCPIGSIGKSDGKCYNCVGVMEYGDTVGATSCKTCQIGTVPVHNYYQRHYKCVNCPIGSIGKSDGKCYNCVGVMEYGDTVGATSCKTCQVGTVPVHNYYQRYYKCVNCRVGTIGKSDGQCHRCDGVMEYGDTIGATSCKSCPLGTVPRLDYNRYQYGCKSCRVGTIGKSDGLCHRCNGPMEYGDSSGATSCKKCPLGSIPKVDYSRYQYGCKQCQLGTIGKSDGKCHRCNGPMEYGDSYGATSCKNCPLGSIPKVDYSRYQYGCKQCQLGTIGKSDGKCYKCIGDRQYVDVYGSTTCKICPSNSRVVIDSRGYHLDCKRWK